MLVQLFTRNCLSYLQVSCGCFLPFISFPFPHAIFFTSFSFIVFLSPLFTVRLCCFPCFLAWYVIFFDQFAFSHTIRFLLSKFSLLFLFISVPQYFLALSYCGAVLFCLFSCLAHDFLHFFILFFTVLFYLSLPFHLFTYFSFMVFLSPLLL